MELIVNMRFGSRLAEDIYSRIGRMSFSVLERETAAAESACGSFRWLGGADQNIEGVIIMSWAQMLAYKADVSDQLHLSMR